VSAGYPQFTAPRGGSGAGSVPGHGSPSLSDQQLRQLPPPLPPSGYPAPAAAPQRPVGIGLAATLAVTASLQWVCGLTLLWLAAAAGADTLSRSGTQGAVFHLLHRFDIRMSDGLAVPLYLLPLASLLTGLLILSQRPWTRIAHTGVGLVAVGWSAWWLQDHLEWWAVGALYIVIGCLVLWTPSASRWYGRQTRHVPPSS
jgi:hypothetical protein